MLEAGGGMSEVRGLESDVRSWMPDARNQWLILLSNVQKSNV